MRSSLISLPFGSLSISEWVFASCWRSSFHPLLASVNSPSLTAASSSSCYWPGSSLLSDNLCAFLFAAESFLWPSPLRGVEVCTNRMKELNICCVCNSLKLSDQFVCHSWLLLLAVPIQAACRRWLSLFGIEGLCPRRRLGLQSKSWGLETWIIFWSVCLAQHWQLRMNWIELNMIWT